MANLIDYIQRKCEERRARQSDSQKAKEAEELKFRVLAAYYSKLKRQGIAEKGEYIEKNRENPTSEQLVGDDKDKKHEWDYEKPARSPRAPAVEAFKRLLLPYFHYQNNEGEK